MVVVHHGRAFLARNGKQHPFRLLEVAAFDEQQNEFQAGVHGVGMPLQVIPHELKGLFVQAVGGQGLGVDKVQRGVVAAGIHGLLGKGQDGGRSARHEPYGAFQPDLRRRARVAQQMRRAQQAGLIFSGKRAGIDKVGIGPPRSGGKLRFRFTDFNAVQGGVAACPGKGAAAEGQQGKREGAAKRERAAEEKVVPFHPTIGSRSPRNL